MNNNQSVRRKEECLAEKVRVLLYLAKMQGRTAREVEKAVSLDAIKVDRALSSLLRNPSLIEVRGKKVCAVTGEKSEGYYLTMPGCDVMQCNFVKGGY